MVESTKNYFADAKIVIFLFVSLLILVDLLVLKTETGLAILTGLVLLFLVLIRPKAVYLLLISLFSMEGFSAMQHVSYPKLVAVILIIGCGMRLIIRREAVPQDNSYILFYLFFAGSLFSFAFARELSVSVTTYITYISLFLLYVLTRYFLKDIADIHTTLNYLFFSTIVMFLFVQAMGITPRAVAESRLSGGIGDSNEYAAYILVLFPLALYMAFRSSGVKRLVYWTYIVAFMLLIILTGSRGGILGFLGLASVLIYYYGIGRVKQIIILLLCIATVLVFFVPDAYWVRASTIINPQKEKEVYRGQSIETRLDNYKASLEMFKEHPWAGVGLYNFQFNNRDYGASRSSVVHNTYLEILTGGGLVSFIPFVLILINCWRRLRLERRLKKNIRDLLICLKASFVSILITSFFLSADHKKILWFLFALISSAYYIAASQDKRQEWEYPQ